jgi:hypothetical protein
LLDVKFVHPGDPIAEIAIAAMGEGETDGTDQLLDGYIL